jgi:hypothetical protein
MLGQPEVEDQGRRPRADLEPRLAEVELLRAIKD